MVLLELAMRAPRQPQPLLVRDLSAPLLPLGRGTSCNTTDEGICLLFEVALGICSKMTKIVAEV